jgi:hypothetical protein
MLERARGYRRDVVDGRWVVRTSQRRTRWEIVVEPDEDQERLVVVTAYAVDADAGSILEGDVSEGKAVRGLITYLELRFVALE